MRLAVYGRGLAVGLLATAVVGLGGCALWRDAPPPGASAHGCWITEKPWHGGGSQTQQPAPTRHWSDDAGACAKTRR